MQIYCTSCLFTQGHVLFIHSGTRPLHSLRDTSSFSMSSNFPINILYTNHIPEFIHNYSTVKLDLSILWVNIRACLSWTPNDTQNSLFEYKKLDRTLPRTLILDLSVKRIRLKSYTGLNLDASMTTMTFLCWPLFIMTQQVSEVFVWIFCYELCSMIYLIRYFPGKW